MSNANQTQSQKSHQYGSKEEPLDIVQARAIIRQDFLKFAELVMGKVELPAGHAFAEHPAHQLEHQLNWNMRCEISSSRSGLSIIGCLSKPDESDYSQVRVEVRYFHPEVFYRDGRKKVTSSRAYNDGFSAILWVDQGRPFLGMDKSLIRGREYCRETGTVESLAASVVKRLQVALAQRTPTGPVPEQQVHAAEMAVSN